MNIENNDNSQLTILVLTDGITPFVTGGMQRHSSNVVKYLSYAGCNVILVHCVYQDARLPSEKEVNQSLFENQTNHYLSKIIGVRFPMSGKIPGHYVRNSKKYSKAVLNAVEGLHYDFVYSKGFAAWEMIDEKRKGRNFPPISVKFHGYEMYQELPSFKQKVDARILRKPTKWVNENADSIFSYGGKITELILREFKVNKDSVYDLTSGIDEVWLRDSVENDSGTDVKRKFVFLGRDEIRKGINELNSIIPEVLQEVDVEFHFIGDIRIQNRIDNPNVIYHGVIRDSNIIRQKLDAMDVILCPSHSEGMPNVIIEGMSRGLAVVATDVGTVELMVDESNGRLITKLDKHQLKKSIIQLAKLSNFELLKMKGKSIEKIKEKFLWKNLISRLIHFVKREVAINKQTQ